MTRMPGKTVAHKDLITAYLDTGPGSALPFVLVHGFTGGKLDFNDQASWFAQSRRVLVPDNRGHGDSTNSGVEADYTIDNLADDLRSFLDTLDVGPIHLLGHSLGGMIAMHFALACPERVRSLVLMDTSPAPLALPRGVREMMTRTLNDNGAPALVRLMRSAAASTEVENGIRYLGEDEHWRRIEEKLAQMDLSALTGLSASMADRQPVTDSLRNLSCPVTVVVGAADKPFLEPSRAMAEAIPRAVLEVIPGAAHCPQYENADLWRQAIDQHLQRAES